MEVDDIKTGVVEGISASDFSCIELALPNLFSQLRLRYSQKSIKVDKILIKYSPLCAPNACGIVRVNIYDRRLDGSDSLQAYYIFPVDCQCELVYYGNGYCSINERQVPWVVKYRIEDSNIKRGVTYCKMKGYLKYSTSDMPDDTTMRPPSISVLSKKYTRENVDVWHCAPTRPVPILSRSLSLGLPEQRRDLLLGGFGECGSTVDDRRGRVSVSEIEVRRGGIGIMELDPGPSVSEVGERRNVVDKKGSVVMDPHEFSDVLRNVIMSVKQGEDSKDVIIDDKGNVVSK
jgi:hypothetical protein